MQIKKDSLLFKFLTWHDPFARYDLENKMQVNVCNLLVLAFLSIVYGTLICIAVVAGGIISLITAFETIKWVALAASLGSIPNEITGGAIAGLAIICLCILAFFATKIFSFLKNTHFKYIVCARDKVKQVFCKNVDIT